MYQFIAELIQVGGEVDISPHGVVVIYGKGFLAFVYLPEHRATVHVDGHMMNVKF